MQIFCACKNFNLKWNTLHSFHTARKCSCEYCSSQNAEYVSDNLSLVSIIIKDSSLHNIQKNGYNTANFHECKNCGLVFVSSKIEKQLFCVLNASNLSLTNYQFNNDIRNYQHETSNERLNRRIKNWCKAELLIK